MRRLLLFLFAIVWPVTLPAAEVRVFAASSLSDALGEIARDYHRRSPDRIVFSFSGSSLLARQIEQGAPADLFLSADDLKMDALERKHLIVRGTRRSILSNTLVVVVPATGGVRLASLRDLASPRVKTIALGETRTIPAGIYARELLTRHHLWSAVAPKVIPTSSARGALSAVASGNVDAAIVFATDARTSPRVRVAIRVPRAEAPSIAYPVAMLTEAINPAGARRFLSYLESRAAREVFAKHGFIVK